MLGGTAAMKEMKGGRLGPDFKTWLRDDPRVRDAISEGRPVEATLTEYSSNDFLLEFLMGSGLWELLVSVKPDGLRKENGKPWRALNGLEVLRELAWVDCIAHTGRVIRDTRLMMIAGFNAEEIERQRRRDDLVVTPETLGNHLARMGPGSVGRAFYKHVSLLLDRKWIGPGTYAADGHEITFPHARGWPGMGKKGEAYGYKLLLLTRIDPGKERIVGFAIAPLQTSEHLLLRVVLRQLNRDVCPIRKLIKTLVLDRGYWGAEFLLGLRRKYGFHFVTRAQNDVQGLAQDVEGLLREPGTAGKEISRKEKRSRLGDIEVRLRAFEKLPLHEEHGKVAGTANVVVGDEYDQQGNPLLNDEGKRRRFYYVTSLPVRGDPYEIRQYYLLRWAVENQGFRNLTQRWSLDVAAGRNLKSIVARTFFVLVLANAERIVEELFPGRWQEERRRMGKLAVPGLIGGPPEVAAYTPQGQMGLLAIKEYGDLRAARERGELIEELRRAQVRGEGIEDVLRRLAPRESASPRPGAGEPERS
jgi:hypothetical protein